MGTKVTRFPEIAAVLLEHVPPLKVPDDMMQNMQETIALKKELGRPVYRIVDVSNLEMSFSDMMLSMAAERGQAGGSDDPDVTTLFIGSGELVELGTKALSEQEQYGKARVHLFTTREEALAFARQQEGK